MFSKYHNDYYYLTKKKNNEKKNRKIITLFHGQLSILNDFVGIYIFFEACKVLIVHEPAYIVGISKKVK